MIGVLLSCTLVAYGFARFRFPGRNLLFLLLISTIFLPAVVTTIPTYVVWRKLGVIGSPNRPSPGCRCCCQRSSPTPTTSS